MNEIPFTAAGNLTRDPELRTTQGGEVAHLSLAVTPQHMNRESGEWQSGETTFLDASVWGPTAGHVTGLHKGDRVLVFGRLVTRVYTPIGANLKRKGGKKGKKEGWQAVLWYRQKNSRKRTRRTTCHLPPMIR